jgi:dihydrofolate reductase
MTLLRAQISISLDGYAAGPNQRPQEPLGDGGEQLHEWALTSRSWREQHGLEGGEDSVDSEMIDRDVENVGAYIMGRKMFGGGPGPWDESWRGWWGDDPPYHVPVFVLTHHARDPLPMQGGTTFHFVTDGIESALAQAREAAGDRDIVVAGGAQAVQQYLAAGLLDELRLHVAPIVLGDGERLLDDVGTPQLEQVEVISSPRATHLRYRVKT